MFFDKPHKVIFLVAFFLSFISSYSQNKITIRANVDKNNIVIGEQIHLYLEADFPLHEPMSFFTIDTIPHFEILDRKKIDTVDNNEGIKLSQSLTLTSFDSGHWVIPAFELDGDRPILTDTIPMNVGFSPFDPKQDYHDIKDIINVQVQKKERPTWYWYIAVSVLLLAAIILLSVRRKKKAVAASPPVDAYDEAKQGLEKLQKEKLASKQFYSTLVDIFRIYISRKKGIASLQETTDDLVVQLRQLKLPDKEFTRLAQTLRMSDFVKFAKYEPTSSEREDAFNTTRQSIDLIEKMHKPEIKSES